MAVWDFRSEISSIQLPRKVLYSLCPDILSSLALNLVLEHKFDRFGEKLNSYHLPGGNIKDFWKNPFSEEPFFTDTSVDPKV